MRVEKNNQQRLLLMHPSSCSTFDWRLKSFEFFDLRALLASPPHSIAHLILLRAPESWQSPELRVSRLDMLVLESGR
jgi:hypothetical protein